MTANQLLLQLTTFRISFHVITMRWLLTFVHFVIASYELQNWQWSLETTEFVLNGLLKITQAAWTLSCHSLLSCSDVMQLSCSCQAAVMLLPPWDSCCTCSDDRYHLVSAVKLLWWKLSSFLSVVSGDSIEEDKDRREGKGRRCWLGDVLESFWMPHLSFSSKDELKKFWENIHFGRVNCGGLVWCEPDD